LKNNLLSISCLTDKGDRISFVNGKVIVLGRDSSVEKATVIRIHEGKIYRLLTNSP